MSTKYSSMNTDLTEMKMIIVKEKEQDQLKNLERIDADSNAYNDIDASSTLSTLRTISSPLKNNQKKVEINKKTLKDIALTENASPKTKRIYKHKHHHHNSKYHRHHHHCHHHHNYRNRVKIANQSSTVACHKVNNNALTNITDEIVNKSALIDDQKAPKVIYHGTNNQESLIIDDLLPRSVTPGENQEVKSSKRNIPLLPIENKILSQRVTSTDEAQVGNFPPMVYTQPATSIIDNYGIQQVERYYVEEDCCFPSSTISCAPNPCVIQQPSTCVCFSQPRPQMLLCTDTNSAQNYICSSSGNIIQQAAVPQQQYICVDNTPSTIINQIPAISSPAQPLLCVPQTSAQPLLCVPQTPVQQTAGIVIQQPQISAQPLQFIQAPQAQLGQYLKISSASPQIIQTIPGSDIQGLQPQILQSQPIMQALQVPTQAIAASPQILYQRPYDPIVLPIQNQQFGNAQSPAIALSQPSYAPPRQGGPGPRMFQHALVRTVAGRTGLPVPLSASGGFNLMPSSAVGSYGRVPLASTASTLLTGGLQPSPSAPIVPLTTGGLLIPFQPSEPSKGLIQGSLPRAGSFQSNLVNFNKTRQQIQQRAQLLADIQQQINNERSLLPSRSANTPFPSLPPLSNNASLSPFESSSNLPRPSPGFSSSLPAPYSGFSSSLPAPYSGFSSSVPIPSSGISSGLPQPPPAVIRSQTPYTGGNMFDTSSSSSSRSSASSIFPTSAARTNTSGLIYSQPSFGGSPRGSVLSGPQTPYQSLRP